MLPGNFESKAELQSSDVRNTILELVDPDPSHRPTARELLEHYKDTAFFE